MVSSLIGGLTSNWLGHLGTLIAILVILGSCLKLTKVATPTGRLSILLQLVSYYARYWFIWLLVWANVQLLYDNQTIYWLLIALSLLYLYMSWVEPNRLRVSRYPISLTVPVSKTHTDLATALSMPTANIAVLSDIHIGIFSNQLQLQRLVNCLNDLPVDAVIILGDWLYHPTADLLTNMQVLKSLNKPCYTVLSEADVQSANDGISEDKQCGDMPIQPPLIHLLPSLGIALLPEQGLNIAGVKVMGIHDGNHSDLPRLIEQQTKAGQPLIIATHDVKQLEANPRTLSDAQNNTLVIAGQTHGGQVNIPLVTPLLVRALTGNKLAAGLRKPHISSKSDVTEKPNQCYQVWVTTGIGMTGLPFRFHCPPSIDVLTITTKIDNE